jgi:hypothetical protein
MKTFVEHCKKLNIQVLARQARGQLMEALLHSSLSVSGQGIKLTTSNCYFGGKRFWLVCPNCSKRVGTLYQKPTGDLLLCRKCHNLTYLKIRYHKML